MPKTEKEKNPFGKPVGVVVGDGICPQCGSAIVIKAQRATGHLCYHCPHPDDGGCGHQFFSRYDKGDRLAAEQIVKKWREPGYRARYIRDGKPEPIRATAEPEPVEPVEPAETPPAAEPTDDSDGLW